MNKIPTIDPKTIKHSQMKPRKALNNSGPLRNVAVWVYPEKDQTKHEETDKEDLNIVV